MKLLPIYHSPVIFGKPAWVKSPKTVGSIVLSVKPVILGNLTVLLTSS